MKVESAPDDALADRSGIVPLPALTFATGLILGVFAITGAGGMDTEALEQTGVDRPTPPQVPALHNAPPVAQVGAYARATRVWTRARELVYYIVGSPEEARSLRFTVNLAAAGEAYNRHDDTAPEYRILLVESPAQEGAALAEIARAGTEHGGVSVSVIDLRAGAGEP